MRHLTFILFLFWAITGFADTQTGGETAPPAPYIPPYQLRPVMPATLLRLDSALAFYDDSNGNSGGSAVATVLTGAYKLSPEFAVLARVGMVNNSPPSGTSGTSFVNPLLGGLYSFEVARHLRLGLFLGMTVPAGKGSGNSPDAAVRAANSAGILARSGMDNALFAVNYLTVIPGVDLAYIAGGWTLQAEMTFLQLTRVQGELVDTDASRTNFTSGLSAGYAILPELCAQAELRYQRWLSNQTVSSTASPAVENLSFALGLRTAFKLGDLTFKPGLAYAQGLAGPIAKSGYTSTTNSHKILFFDIPIFF